MKNCSQCSCSLENEYTTSYYNENNELIKVLCHKCEKENIFSKHVETKILTSQLIEMVALDFYSLSHPYNARSGEGYKGSLRELMDNGLAKDFDNLKIKCEINASFLRVRDRIKQFEKEVWFAGLQNIVISSDSSKLSASYDKIKILIFSSSGRTLITIYENDIDLTLITAEDSKESSMGFRGSSATEEQIISLLDKTTALFKDNILEFSRDHNISYCCI